MKKKAVITGIGVVSPIGIGCESFWKNLLDNQTAFKPIRYFDTTKFKSKLAAQVEGLEPAEYIGKKGLRYLNNGTKFLSSATKMVLDDAKFPDDEAMFDDVGIIIGSSLGNFAETTDYFHDIIRQGASELSPMKSFDVALNSSINHASVFFKTKAFARTISSGFTSGTDAIGDGLRMIQNGKAKAVIVGGSEHISIDLFMIFYLRQQLASNNGNLTESSLPFGKGRNGFILGEGSFLVMLEESEFAKERGAKPYCELAGYGITLGANSKFTLEKKIEKAEKAMSLAIDDAGINKEQVTLISANANSSKELDMIEATAINNCFYKNSNNKPLVNAVKSTIGECYGASGAAQIVATTMSLKSNDVPSIANYNETDIGFDLNLVTTHSKKHEGEIALVNSFDYLGNDSCLVLRKAE